MGLGNKLFSWSRAICTTNILKNSILLDSVWFSPRNAALLRGGIDYRNILGKNFLLNNFKVDPLSKGKFISLMKINLLFTEECCLRLNSLRDLEKINFSKNLFITYKCSTEHNFLDLSSHKDFIKSRLLSIVKCSNPIEPEIKHQYIAINYRSGNDFKNASVSNQNTKQVSSQTKTNINWFSHALNWVSKEYGNLPIKLITDGSIKHVQELVKGHSNIEVTRTHKACDDLIIMSKASVILASGNSSFSAWGSFLSGADTYSSPETPLNKWLINHNNPGQIISTID